MNLASADPKDAHARDSQDASRTYGRTARYLAAILTVGAGWIHFAVAPHHLAEYLPFGILFLVVGGAQIVLGVATLLRPSPRVFAGAALVALGCLAVWAVSRSAGLPIGPSVGRTEPLATEDVIASLLEAGSVLLFA